jgi:mono/diheme cytochrome c family protein
MHLTEILIAVLGALAALLAEQPTVVQAESEGLSKGKALYQQVCIQCHGFDGRGNGTVKLNPPPADLTSPRVQNKLDAGLFKSIHEGSKNTAMGAWKYALTEEETYAVIAYVRQLGSGGPGLPNP